MLPRPATKEFRHRVPVLELYVDDSDGPSTSAQFHVWRLKMYRAHQHPKGLTTRHRKLQNTNILQNIPPFEWPTILTWRPISPCQSIFVLACVVELEVPLEVLIFRDNSIS